MSRDGNATESGQSNWSAGAGDEVVGGSSLSAHASHIAVIGGGITGLTAALRLAQRGFRVTLWERGELLGGQANAFPVVGTAIERFYHHLFQSDREIVALADEIGIGDRLLWLPSNVGYFADGRIWPLNGALDLLRLGFLPVQDGFASDSSPPICSASGTGNASKR